MQSRLRRLFRRNLRRIIAAGAGRRKGGFDESMLRTWFVLSDLSRERIDPRRRPPGRARPLAREDRAPAGQPSATRA
jgi:hypothetical protein